MNVRFKERPKPHRELFFPLGFEGAVRPRHFRGTLWIVDDLSHLFGNHFIIQVNVGTRPKSERSLDKN
jgi:hypothetical protein